ncbi:MAG TPA: hypothetical protein VFT98_08425 [Myxococcota bacterium]|nr:hypothetical protein [Myxococcota bacterium]
MQETRDTNRDENREDWQSHADESREDRQDYAKEGREDWQEHSEDMWEEGGGGAYWAGGVYVGGPVHVVHYGYYNDNEWAAVAAGFVIGTAITAATYQSATTKSGCTLTEVNVNGTDYFRCPPTWYIRVMQGGEVNYVVVAAPPGF